MKEFTFYVSDDGNVFLDYYDCYLHEARQKHKDFFNIEFFDGNGNKLKSELVYNLYNSCEALTIHNEKELVDLGFVSTEIFGWCEFDQITSVGKWTRHDNPVNPEFEGVWSKE